MATKPLNPLELSDEDISNMIEPPAGETPAGDAIADAASAATPDGEPAGTEGLDPVGSGEAPETPADDTPLDPGAGEKDAEEEKPQLVPVPGSEPEEDPTKKEEGEAPKKQGDAPADPAGETKSGEGEDLLKGEEQPTAALADFYNKVMTPFKANGKTIEVRSPEEAIKLMQMGANYTRKLQDLQPHRKVLMMLENNGLLDEGKLSYLIDLDRKDPEAIKKLIKDTGLDPLEIDVTGDPAYREGSHRVSDEEVGFRTTLDELSSNPTGVDTLNAINSDWDQASKEALWQTPDIMTVIHEQREAGIYDVIKSEVDRQMTLGNIPPNTPFLQAYKTVGDAMASQVLADSDGGEPQNEPKETGQAKPQILATRTATPRQQVSNGDKASAASPTRGSPTTKPAMVNPLAESDEAFLKRMENRL